MSTSPNQDVLAYRLDKLNKAPRKWAYWIAFFSFLNALFLSINHDVVILAGLVFPFMLAGSLHHFVIAAILAALAYYPKTSLGIKLVFAIYAVDTLLSAYLGWWSGVIMHIVVFVFVAFALNGAKQLLKQGAPQSETAQKI